MESKFDPVSTINPIKDTWTLKVKVLRSWMVFTKESKQKNFYELILIDENVSNFILINIYPLFTLLLNVNYMFKLTFSLNAIFVGYQDSGYCSEEPYQKV